MPGKESKFPGIKNTEEENVFKSSNHTIVCEDTSEEIVKTRDPSKLEDVDGNTNNIADTKIIPPITGVFIASIDDKEISGTDLDDATEVIENIVKTEGLLAEGNHLMSSQLELHCDGHENWTILSQQFRYVNSWEKNKDKHKYLIHHIKSALSHT